jgi:ATP-dependent Clp protease ATP-binding subunit ClpC
MTSRRDVALLEVRKLAEDLAKKRGERVSTGHLLCVLSTQKHPCAELLAERRLTEEVLLRGVRVAQDDQPDSIQRVFDRARDAASRHQTQATRSDVSPFHILFALCQEPKTAAHRILEQCGTDLGKLRLTALQVSMGLTPPRRATAAVLSPSAQRTFPPARALPASAAPPQAAPSASPSTPAPQPPKNATTAAPPLPSQAGTKTPAPPQRAPHAPHASGAPSATAKQKPKKPKTGFALDAKTFPVLCQLGRNLTELAAQGALESVVGRDEEIERTLDVLAKKTANSPCLVGSAGVGKTSVVLGLAMALAAADAEEAPRIVVEISPTTLLSNTGMRGQLAEKLAQVRAELLKAQGRVILFLDEIHTLLSPDAGDEAASELKLMLGRGEIACIGATTSEEYQRTIDRDPALARRFVPIEVVELDREAAFLAITRLLPGLEAHHRTHIPEEIVAQAIAWSVRYLPYKTLPDKAVQILDLAGARAGRRGLVEVTAEQLADVAAEMLGVPCERLLESDAQRMLRFESLVAERVVGHEAEVAKIGSILRRNASGIVGKRPIGVFLLLGPTGVGKTETAKAVASTLFFSEAAMTRIDMSEYAESHAIARLVGAPPGYVGFEAGGQLTEAVRKRPYQVLLLDEVEKAHRDVLEAFLQVFDEGRMTDGRGRTVDFTNTVIFVTSNLGADVTGESASIGFGRVASRKEAHRGGTEARVIEAARAALSPELFNRFDETLVFAPLGKGAVAEIARRMLDGLGRLLRESRGVELDVSDDAVEVLLARGGFEPSLGARPMRRAIGRLVEARIADLLLRGEATRGDVILVDARDGDIELDVARTSQRAAAS